ncbi:MAG: acyl carrier protein [Ruminococcus sp.]
MEGLQEKIYQKLIERMDVNESEIEGFDFDSPIFNTNDADDSKVCMGLDSIDALELVVLIYDEWGIDVPTDDMPKLRTVNNIATYIREHE